MKKGKVLALDYGTKRVGVASGDMEFKIAFPRDVIPNKGMPDLVEKVKDLCDELDVSVIVIGLPLNMEEDQIENEILPEIKKFIAELKKGLDEIDIMLYDERLSTFEADKLMKEAIESYGKKKLGIDAYAAQIILQRFFDKKAY